MSEINKKIKIDIEVNSSEAQQNLEDLTNEVENLNQESAESTKSLSQIWSSFKKGIGSAKSLRDALKVVGTSLKALIANPIGAVIAAVGIAVKALTDAFKRNDDAATSLKRVMDLLQVPLKLIQRLVDLLVGVIGKLLDRFMNLAGNLSEKIVPAIEKVSGAIQKITDKLRAVADWAKNNLGLFGRIFGTVADTALNVADKVAKGVEKAVKSGVSLAKLQDELTKRQEAFQDRQLRFQEQSSLREAKIAELREKISDSENNSLDERMKMLDEVEKLEKQELGERLSMTNEAVAIEKLRQKVENDASDEAKKALSDLIVARNNANTQYSQAQRKYNKERERMRNEEKKKEEEALKEANERAKKQAELENRLHEMRLGNARKLAEENEGVMGALELLSIDYLEEQRKIAAQMEEVQGQIDGATGETLDTLKKMHEELGTTLELSTKTYKQNVSNLLAGVGEELSKFKVGDDESFDEQRETVQNAYDNAQKALKDSLDQRLVTQAQFDQAMIDLAIQKAGAMAEIEEAETKKSEEEEEKRKKTREEYAKGAMDILGSAASAFGSIASAYQNEYNKIKESGEELTAAQRQQAVEALEKQKAATIIQFALQQAQAIGNAVIAATSAASMSGPAAAVVYAATFASMLAGIISSFVSLKSSLSSIDQQIAEMKAPKKLARGGYVEGPGSSTSDSIPARLSNGESVINARSTAMFYDELSRINQAGGGRAFPDSPTGHVYPLHLAQGGVVFNDSMTKALASAMENIHPVVSVKEITDTQKRIKMKENK